MAKLLSEGGIRYLEELRSPKKDDTEAKKIAVELPDVPLLIQEDNPCKWDLVFVCSDGIVYGHRLVISNASKYIMHMLDDQPPWYTTYIHVLDLKTDIVQLLVDLAYTGEMRMTEDLQSDVIDAMHTLGWVHTDLLSADYDVAGEPYVYHADLSKSPKREKHNQRAAASDSIKENQTARKSSPKRSSASNVVEEEEDAMEISQLPDVDLTDSDSDKSKLDLDISTQKKLVASEKGKPKRRIIGKSKSHANNKNINSLPKKKLTEEKGIEKPSTSIRKSSRRASLSLSEENKSVSRSSVETKPKSKGRTIMQTKDNDDVADEEPNQATQPCQLGEGGNSVHDSPGKRQRRKPKRFEEYEELDKPKARASPVKSISEAKSSRGGKKSVVQQPDLAVSETSSNPQTQLLTKSSQDDAKLMKSSIKTPPASREASSSTSTNRATKSKSVRKRKLSAEIPQNPLITSYFNKKDSIKTEKQDGSSNPSQNSIETNDTACSTSTINLAGREKSSDNELDTNDNKLQVSASTVSNKSSRILERKQMLPGNDSTDDDDEYDNMPILSSSVEMGEKLKDNKQKSFDLFDGIRSSHIDKTTEDGESGTQENGDEPDVDKQPARKSSRVASKAHSPDENEDNDKQDDSLARKRPRKESTETSNRLTDQDVPPRRSSKQ